MMGTFVENVNSLAGKLTVDNVADINITADNIGSVTSVVDNIASVNDVATNIVPNLAEILQADTNAAIATAQAGIATTKATEALASANAADVSEANALASEMNAAALLDQFDDRYLGSKVSDPLLDNDGGTLLDGVLYWNTTTNQMMVYDLGNVMWVPALSFTANTTATLTNKTLDDISNKVGANHIHHECRNVSGSPIAAGVVVTAQGIQSGTDYIEIVPVTNPQTQIAIGITHQSINNNGTGLVINTGVSDDYVNTNAWTVGTILYPNTSGGLTPTKPTSGVYQACAIVLRQHGTQGRLLVEFTEPKDTLTTVVRKDSDTGAASIPSGTTAQRPATPAVGYLRFNTDLAQAEMWNGTAWSPVGGVTDSPTFTGTVTLPSTTSIGTVSSVELGYLDGVTSSVQTQINGKIGAANYASADGTVGGTVKARISGSTLYLTTNGNNA